MKYANRAELLRAVADSIEMQEKAGIIPVYKCDGNIVEADYANGADFTFGRNVEFPLSVVEGKPVFVGDELYDTDGEKFTITNDFKSMAFFGLSWTKPKPKTVMVELLRDDAASMSFPISQAASCVEYRIAEACRKALEDSK